MIDDKDVGEGRTVLLAIKDESGAINCLSMIQTVEAWRSMNPGTVSRVVVIE